MFYYNQVWETEQALTTSNAFKIEYINVRFQLPAGATGKVFANSDRGSMVFDTVDSFAIWLWNEFKYKAVISNSFRAWFNRHLACLRREVEGGYKTFSVTRPYVI